MKLLPILFLLCVAGCATVPCSKDLSRPVSECTRPAPKTDDCSVSTSVNGREGCMSRADLQQLMRGY
jgi:hypothetical protein